MAIVMIVAAKSALPPADPLSVKDARMRCAHEQGVAPLTIHSGLEAAARAHAPGHGPARVFRS